MRRKLKNTPANSSAPRQQPGGFQLFDLKQERAEEAAADARARAVERAEADKKAFELKQRMSRIEASYSTAARIDSAMQKASGRQLSSGTQKPADTAKQSAGGIQKPADTAKQSVKRRRRSAGAAPSSGRRSSPVKPVLPPPVPDLENAALLNKTLDSSRNFSTVHSAAQKIQTENSSRRTAPKAQLQNMDAFWEQMEEARKRETEERREREIRRARQQELEKARQQEAAIARMKEEEARLRRESEERRRQELELRRQNEEAAEKWRAEETARVREEAERMRQIQIIKRREAETARVQALEVAKIREAQISRVQKEEEENIRRELERILLEEEQHAQIENHLEKKAADFLDEGAILRDAELEKQRRREQEEKERRFSGEIPEKEPDPLDDIGLEDVPDESADTAGLEDVPDESADTAGLEDVPDESAEDAILEDLSDESVDEIELYDDSDEPEDEEDDFDEEIKLPSRKVPVKKNGSRAFVLPSFGQILDSEKPKETRKARIPSRTEAGAEQRIAQRTVSPEIQEITEQKTEEAKITVQKTEEPRIAEPITEEPITAELITEEPITEEPITEEPITEELITEEPITAELITEEPEREEYCPTAENTAAAAVEERSIQAEKDSSEQQSPDPEKNTPHDCSRKTEKKSQKRIRNLFNRKKYDSMLGKITAAALACVMLLNLIIPDKSSSELENRELKQVPSMSVSSVLDGTWSENMEAWQSDQFTGRNILRNLQSFLRWIGGDREENGVYFGKGGQLLEKIVKPKDELLQTNLSEMNAFAEKYPDKRYGMLLVPDAGTILKDSYPAFAEAADQRGDFGKVKSLLSENWIWADGIGAMEAHSDEKLYYKTDHHWTSAGAYRGYQEFCSAFGLQSGTYTVHAVSDSFNGVLASTSGFCLGEKETIEIYTPEAQTREIVTYTEDGRQTTSLYDTEKLKTRDQYAVFLGGNYPMIDIKTTTDTDRVLLLFKDSFANSMVPFLTEQYREIVVVDPRYYYSDISEVMLTYGISDVLFLYSGNTFFEDHNLQGVLNGE